MLNMYKQLTQTSYQALRQYPRMVKYLAAWGFTLDALQKAAFQVFTNRIPGYSIDGGTAIQDEFSLPTDPRVCVLNVQLARERGTLACVFDALNAMAHPNVSVYNSSGRIDSPYATAIPAGAVADINARYASTSSYPLLQSGSAWANNRYTVVIWDGNDGGQTPPRVGFNLGSCRLRYTASPDWSYTGERDHSALVQGAKMGGGIASVPAELFICYPNLSSGLSSTFLSNGNPTTSNDIVEIITLSIYNWSF